jgi:hypothetical protein
MKRCYPVSAPCNRSVTGILCQIFDFFFKESDTILYGRVIIFCFVDFIQMYHYAHEA